MLFVILTFLLPAGLEDTLSLGAGQAWYEQDKNMAQQIEGILDYQSGGGRVGVPANFRPFRVARQDAASGKVIIHPVHAPGHETTLALHVGQRVRVEAKVVSYGEGEARQDELWIGKLTPLGPAPANAFTEIKPVARTNRFIPQQIRHGNEASTLVLRSAKDVARQLGQGEGLDAERTATQLLAAMLGVKTIDWKNQMVIFVGTTSSRAAISKKLEITRLDVNDRGVTVTWKQQSAPRGGATFISDTILIPKVEGEVIFKKEEPKEDDAADAGRIVPQPPAKK
jgi:hypothetical protein